MAFRIIHGKAQAVVGVSLDGRHSHTVRDQMLAQLRDVIGGEGNMIQAVGSFGIRRGAVAHPLPAHYVSDEPARLHRRSGSQPERSAVNSLRSVWLSRVEGNVIDPENARPGDGAGLRVCANCKDPKCKQRDKLSHKAFDFSAICEAEL